MVSISDPQPPPQVGHISHQKKEYTTSHCILWNPLNHPYICWWKITHIFVAYIPLNPTLFLYQWLILSSLNPAVGLPSKPLSDPTIGPFMKDHHNPMASLGIPADGLGFLYHFFYMPDPAVDLALKRNLEAGSFPINADFSPTKNAEFRLGSWGCHRIWVVGKSKRKGFTETMRIYSVKDHGSEGLVGIWTHKHQDLQIYSWFL